MNENKSFLLEKRKDLYTTDLKVWCVSDQRSATFPKKTILSGVYLFYYHEKDFSDLGFDGDFSE